MTETFVKGANNDQIICPGYMVFCHRNRKLYEEIDKYVKETLMLTGTEKKTLRNCETSGGRILGQTGNHSGIGGT